MDDSAAKLAALLAEAKFARSVLEESAGKFNALFEASVDAVLIGAPDGRLLAANSEACRMFGHSESEICAGGRMLLVDQEDPRLPHLIEMRTQLDRGRGVINLRRKDGTVFPSEYSWANFTDRGNNVLSTITVRDISERVHQQRVRQLRLAFGAISRAIIHATDQKTLFDEVCRISIESGGFVLVWIGLLDTSSDRISHAAACGPALGYLTELQKFCGGEGSDPACAALRQNYTAIASDYALEPLTPALNAAALSAGIKGSMSIPFAISGKQRGVLAFYSAHKAQFDGEAAAVLDELAREISFALALIKRSGELEESEARFRAIQQQSIAALYVLQDGKLVYTNPAMRELFGYAADEPLDPDPLAHVAEEDQAMVMDQIKHRLADTPRAAYSFMARRADGHLFRFGIEAQRVTYLGKPAILAIGRNVSEQEEAAAARDARLQRYEAQLRALQKVTSSQCLLTGDVAEFARELTEAAAEAVGSERANLWVFNETETELRCIDSFEASTHTHTSGATLHEAQFAAEFGALKAATYVDASSPLTDPRTGGYAATYLKPLRITSMLDAVVRLSGRNLGLLCLEHVDRPHEWHQDEIAFACQLGDKFALAIVNSDRLAAELKLRRSLLDSIAAISAVVEMRDPYTAGHERRVAELAAAIATEMGLPESMIEGIHFGGLLHDLGKIQVPAEILSKPTRLSDIEYELVRAHAQAGYDILKGIQFPWPVAEMARQHHERIDGSGYPRHLKGEEILAEARILAVADTVEAMASHRPYRAGLGLEDALAEIERGSGVIYDATAAAACLRLFREKRYTLSI